MTQINKLQTQRAALLADAERFALECRALMLNPLTMNSPECHALGLKAEAADEQAAALRLRILRLQAAA